MAGYIGIPIETDPDVLTAEALDSLANSYPGFSAKEAHLEVWVTEVCARMNAETRNLASLVPDDIFRYFGESLVRVVPVAAASAAALTTWTMQDIAGYTIAEGTVVAYRTAGDRLSSFVTTQARTVPPGQTQALEVPIRSLETGAQYNGLGPTGLELVDSLSFVKGIVASAPTSGGVDPESDEEYLGRLRDEMTLLTPRFVHASDAAVLARRISGVHRALGIDNYEPSELIAGANRTAASTTITAPANSFIAEDVGRTAAGTDIPANTTIATFVSSTQVTLSAAATTTAAGFALTLGSRTGREKMVTIAVVSEQGTALSAVVKTQVGTYLQGMREVNFIIHVVDPTYTNIDVNFQVVANTGFELVDLGARCRAAVSSYLSPATWAGGGDTPPTWRKSDNVVRYLEVAEVLNRVDGVNYVDTLTINGGGVNVVLAGVAPLPTVGAVTGGASNG